MTRRAPLWTAILALAACGSPDPEALFQQGRYAEAAAAYRGELARRPGSAEAQYNLGTATLRLGEFEGSRPHLERASRTGRDTVREWAFYNLGNSRLEPVLDGAVEDGAAAELSLAIVAYKRALLLDPHDDDAKWNLELARRLLEREPRSPRARGGGGGGAGGGEGGGADRGRDDPLPRPASGAGPDPKLSRADAERLLDGAEQREVGIQREKLRKTQPPVVSH